TRRAWRKLVKKQQRHRRRQKQARQREKDEAIEKKARESDPEYQAWLKQQVELEEFQRLASERLRQDEEEAWLRREALAQHQFQIDAAKRAQQEAELDRLRAQQAEAFAAQQKEQRKRREESKRLADAAAAEFEAMLHRMHEYMEDTEERSPPDELRRLVETHPEERLCEFYTRTNCCRYGHSCTFNHRRPMLAKILLIRHFFTHPLLQVNVAHKEYAGADEHLELTQHDLRADYDEFFKDATGELEKFGKIVNFRAVCNTLPHLRGHVFVEYAHERFALRAFINLQGRYYAARRLNVEFSNLKAWRGAVCGLSLTRKCPKGYSCGYLHLFRNPNNLFNSSLELYETPRSARSVSRTPKSRQISWNDNETQSRNWRWSESPELELKNCKSSSSSSQRRHSNERDTRSRQEHSRKHYHVHSSRESGQHKSRSRSASDSRRDYSRSRTPTRRRVK
ncbi:U2 small nuclear ribonucleoprotein auxiliary factor 35 kDa subunit-related protein 2, partial [Drosophila montana]|uniref:U2 small nuclear ribonucleoprotein auxiliary factor 35 kDa subunit-related protein 2 n=1 Tax=Drosophila montana TaxID=40370 RepID=UPI00313C39C5